MGEVIKVSVKWGKENYQDVEVDMKESPLVFKSQLFALTGVPPDRQKVMIKGALLKDDEWGKATPKPGAAVMLMGSAEPKVVEAPKDLPKFVEDLPEAQQAHLATRMYGSGLQNLGNTCYMNSVVQCLYAVKPLRDQLELFKPAAAADPTNRLVLAARDLLKDMSDGGEPFAPYAFLLTLRERFPQFAQQGQGGMYSQQDAEECWTNLMYTLREKLKDTDEQSAVERLFGIGTNLKLKCEESNEEQQESGMAYSLKCNIDNSVNHLHDGILLGLKDDREKRSESLGRTALWRGSSVLTKLPPYLTIQLVRFFYKTDTQSKAKVLRKVTYSLEFDAYEFCSPELKQALDGPRAEHKEIQDMLTEAQKTKKLKPGTNETTAPAPTVVAAAAAPAAADASAAAPMETDGAAAASAAATGAAGGEAGAGAMEVEGAGAAGSSKGGRYTGAHTGRYELLGVLTHKGRSADSGHYVAWIKQADKSWVLFDDDELIPKKDEDILALSGGGDWHMAYLLLYRAITVPPMPTPEPTVAST